MHHVPQLLRRLFGHTAAPAVDRANVELAHQLMQELEDQQPPSTLLLNIATGFPSALLCVLAAGAMAGALAGREVSLPQAPSVPAPAAQATLEPLQRAASALAGRAAQLQELELQALAQMPQRAGPPPVADSWPR